MRHHAVERKESTSLGGSTDQARWLYPTNTLRPLEIWDSLILECWAPNCENLGSNLGWASGVQWSIVIDQVVVLLV